MQNGGDIMYIELKCCSCGKSFRVEFTSEEYNIDKCPKCESRFANSDVTRIREITESFFMNVDKIDSVKIYGIHKTEYRIDRTVAVLGTRYFDDMKCLDEIYYSSSPEVKRKLEALVDKFYLLVNRDAKSENLDSLDATLDKMNAIFLEKIEDGNAKMEKILGLDQEA